MVAYLVLKDRKSCLLIVANGLDYEHPDYCLHNQKYRLDTATVKIPSLTFKVSYYGNHNNYGDDVLEWKHLEYKYLRGCYGVMAFIDSFMCDGGLQIIRDSKTSISRLS